MECRAPGDLAGLKKSKEDLKAALASPSPDEAKVKGLVDAFRAAQLNLFILLRMSWTRKWPK